MRHHLTVPAAAALGLLAVPAGASIVHFTNPDPGETGHFAWTFDVEGPASWLDITLAPHAQTNAPGPGAVAQTAGAFGNLHHPVPNAPGQHALVLGQLGSTPYTIALSFGDPLIGATWEFLESTVHFAGEGFTHFAEGEARYIGVLTQAGQYGWIEVIRHGSSLQALSWAHQTRPGVMIHAGQIPAPGAVPLLAVAILTAGRRRRSMPRT